MMTDQSKKIISLHMLLTQAADLADEIAKGFDTNEGMAKMGYIGLSEVLTKITDNIPLPDEEMLDA